MREQQDKRNRFMIGLDLGDWRHRFCVLGEKGEMVEEGSVGNNRVALKELSVRYPGALVVMEAGCHSPWLSRYLEEAGCEVVVSNPRKTRAIYQHERKSDRRDALMLARIARMEPALLYPVRHGSEQAQQDLLRIKLRDSLVRARVGPQFGLVAEDVEKVNPDLVARDEQGKPYTVRYEAVNAMLLNEFLKEHQKVEQMRKQIEALTAGLQKVSAQLELNKSEPQTVVNNR